MGKTRYGAHMAIENPKVCTDTANPQCGGKNKKV